MKIKKGSLIRCPFCEHKLYKTTKTISISSNPKEMTQQVRSIEPQGIINKQSSVLTECNHCHKKFVLPTVIRYMLGLSNLILTDNNVWIKKED